MFILYQNDKLLRKLNIKNGFGKNTHNGHALEYMFIVNWNLQQEQETFAELIVPNKCVFLIYA